MLSNDLEIEIKFEGVGLLTRYMNVEVFGWGNEILERRRTRDLVSTYTLSYSRS